MLMLRSGAFRSGVLCATCAVLLAAALDLRGDDARVTFELRAAGGGPQADPPLPPTSEFPVQLVVDDDSAEGVVGAGIGTAEQFLWLNRFDPPPEGVRLQQVWVLFPPGPNLSVGADVQLAIFADADGDPSNGATFLRAEDVTIQELDGTTFSIYDLVPAVEVPLDADVLIGVVPRFVATGVTPSTQPAAIDTTASLGQSWIALWPDAAPLDAVDPPLLETAESIQPIDDFQAGNWLVRGFGTGVPVVLVPTLDTVGLTAMVVLLGLAGIVLARRRGAL